MAGRMVALVIGLALVAGCAGAQPDAAPAGDPAVHPRWESCDVPSPDGQDALTMPRLDDAFVPVAAVICRDVPQERASGGSDMVAIEERADDVTALVSALRLPDEEPTEGACTMELPFVPWLVLLDGQGRWVRPGVPVDSCRKPRQEVRTAYDQLRTVRVKSRVLREIESDQAAASGCSQTWGDMVWSTGKLGGGRNSPGPLPADDAEAHVCVYRVPPAERGGDKPAGEFESGGKLAAGRWPKIKRALTAAGPASECTTPGTRFAVLRLSGVDIYVEADGCRRVLIEGGTGPSSLRDGTAEVAGLLFE